MSKKESQRMTSDPRVFLSFSKSLDLKKKRSSIGSPSSLRTMTVLSPSFTPRTPRVESPQIPEQKDDFERLQSFIEVLSPKLINKKKLQKLSWNGIAWQLRHKVWKILLGQVPLDQDKVEDVLKQKRTSYIEMRKKMLNDLRVNEENHYIQIKKDLKRSNKEIPFLFNSKIQTMMENVLLVWALRHPACGYVQGMNDLLVPLIYVYMTEYTYDQELTDERINIIPSMLLECCEADSYWGLDSIMSRIQDNYTLEQQGIMNKVQRMEQIVKIATPELYQHLADNGVMFLQFAFRWINCCLLREFKLGTALRLWDSYMSVEDGTGFSELNMYCSASLLTYYSKDLLNMDFSEIIQFLQHLPTNTWGEQEIQVLVTQAFIYENTSDFASCQ
ncbi:TBC domain containing protein [Entamoeba histolytica HM-1:IMSS-B]|uniref:TBC domain containing protein n=6 Tax=Entamoeba histolytica TaxID=5759 RepID=C4MA41_ENTH1|nr:TBC domain containing protein [Entamoeba histolytica HM-1:IMSS]EMD46683.1 TBC domain containing protein [Entamoeba histolytica KU27]EMH76635.1 TBC domain containing protein [Entamoeba histolytica HM-1:IMSS-B]EMS11852.1 TBC domain containing protein [Entamoeba histolytica HM-3:IMSS]ENY63141.1 TBC domain containing protein [Entamoeba histolytica HM-1:IMSS-A]GAT98618.1 tbc domain containing protein [Entamoeba histolytica]|eukprot:XP_654100.1 TBC domain containing protein [Entamoeba histolytica HM-1:IMSS]